MGERLKIPDWAKHGPVDLANYDLRAAWYMQISGREEHPYIENKSEGFADWYQYFARHLGGLPKTMQLLIAGKMNAMNVPERNPAIFDPSFQADPDYRVPRTSFQVEHNPEMAERFTRFVSDLMAGKFHRIGFDKEPAPMGTAFDNYDEALRRHGKPYGINDLGRILPYRRGLGRRPENKTLPERPTTLRRPFESERWRELEDLDALEP